MTTPAHHDVMPYQIAEDTFLITWGLDAPPVGHFPMHSLLIRGKEPVLVDTGAPACREQWLATVAALVDPADVRWVFLSHDDRDHAGNLLPVLAACPCHSPVLRGQRIDEAFDLMRQLPALDPWREFDQSDLDRWLADAGALSEPSIPAH